MHPGLRGQCGMSRVYIKESVLPFGEDSKHEFKGHRCLSVEELPKWCFVPGTFNRTRRAVSRTLNGFLNTGQGGTVYLGILDDGTVSGIPMSPFQIEHLKVSLSDLLKRYNPPVMKSQYKVCFVPVVNADTKCMDLILHNSECSEEKNHKHNREMTQMPEKMPRGMQYKAHLLRTSKWCWCDKLVHEQLVEGVKQPRYIVEITIHPFFFTFADPVALQLHPIYEDEEGRCYLRRTASTAALTYQEISEMTKIQARNHFEQVIQSLQKEVDMYEESVIARLGMLF